MRELPKTPLTGNCKSQLIDVDDLGAATCRPRSRHLAWWEIQTRHQSVFYY